jgi:hypothetical protein
MAEYTQGMPMEIGGFDRLWKGSVKTNGILMLAADGRIPHLTEGYSRINIAAANVLAEPDVIPWGNGLWRAVSEIDVNPGARYAQAPAAANKPVLVGIFKFNQGWQAGNPIQPYGMPSYSTGIIIRKGLVGYEHAMAAAEIGDGEDYLKYVQGDRSSSVDVNTVRTLYADWVAAWQAAAAGSRLGLFVDDTTGFPVVSVVLAANLAAPTLTGCTFVGFAEVFAKEHERVYFDVRL